MNNPSLKQLQNEQASAKTKMILGIIFVGVAFLFTFLGLALIFEDEVFVILLFMALALWGVGVPFLIIGIVNNIRYSRQIALMNQPNYYTPPAQPQWQQPPQPQYQQPQPQWQQPPQPQYQQPQPQWQQPPQGDLDWRKYNPLQAGVSLKPGKDYKFHRAEGFVGSVPQNFVNRTFPKCPICCTNAPYWTIAQHNQMSWKGNLYLFKCSCCQGIISMSMPDVTTLGNGAGGVVANPNVGLTNLMFKASSGKEAGAVYAVIESVGYSGVTRECEGKEFKLEHLQDMFLRK